MLTPVSYFINFETNLSKLQPMITDYLLFIYFRVSRLVTIYDRHGELKDEVILPGYFEVNSSFTLSNIIRNYNFDSLIQCAK